MMADRQTTGGYSKIGCVIAADIPLLAQLKPGDDLVQGPVTAAGDDEIRVSRLVTGIVYGIAVFLRHVDGTEEAGPVENRDDVREEATTLASAGGGVNDKMKRFHISIITKKIEKSE